MIKPAILAALLLTSACASKCDQLKDEFKSISAAQMELTGGDPLAGLTMALDPAKREKFMAINARLVRLQNAAVQAECPLEEIAGLRAG